MAKISKKEKKNEWPPFYKSAPHLNEYSPKSKIITLGIKTKKHQQTGQTHTQERHQYINS